MQYAKLLGAALSLGCCLLSSVAHADTNGYVHTPIVEQGEREIDFKWGGEKDRAGASDTATSLGLGYGVNSWWFTEVYAKDKRAAGQSNAFDAIEWENRFQLTDTGKYPVDVGFLLEIERPKDRTEGYEITYGPLFQSEWGQVQGNLNLLIQKHVKATAAFDTELHYETQVKYRQSEQFEWGAQALGSMGPWDHWSPSSDQDHKIGPAVFGKINLGGRQAIQWNAGLLHGTSHAAAKTTLRIQAEYEF